MRSGCESEASRTFCFEATVSGYNGPAIGGEVNVMVCAAHATEEEGNELMANVEVIVAEQCAKLGKQRPDLYRFMWETLQ